MNNISSPGLAVAYGSSARALQGLHLPAWLLALCCLFTLVSSPTFAEDEEGVPPESIYVSVDPAFVTNYGGPGRLRYMKIEVSLRVTGSEGEASVTRHMPAIRDALLTLFSLQTDNSIGSAEGKEQLRVDSLDKVHSLLAEEDGESLAEDLLFTEFVVHS